MIESTFLGICHRKPDRPFRRTCKRDKQRSMLKSAKTFFHLVRSCLVICWLAWFFRLGWSDLIWQIRTTYITVRTQPTLQPEGERQLPEPVSRPTRLFALHRICICATGSSLAGVCIQTGTFSPRKTATLYGSISTRAPGSMLRGKGNENRQRLLLVAILYRQQEQRRKVRPSGKNPPTDTAQGAVTGKPRLAAAGSGWPQQL